MERGEALAGEAHALWGTYPDCGPEALQDALADGLAALFRAAVAEADETAAERWRRDRAGAAAPAYPADGGGAAERIAERVAHWGTVLADLAYEEVRFARDGERAPADPEEVTALLGVTLLGGPRGARAGERLAELLGALIALRVGDRARDELDAMADGLLRTECGRRLASLDALDVEPQQQAELIAAYSVLEKVR